MSNRESVTEDPIDVLEHEIEGTRQALDQTLRALRTELSPRHQLEVAWNSAKGRTARGVRTGARWMYANREPLLIAAIGVAGVLFQIAANFRRRGR
jgi:uncharacterized protein DUF3618